MAKGFKNFLKQHAKTTGTLYNDFVRFQGSGVLCFDVSEGILFKVQDKRTADLLEHFIDTVDHAGNFMLKWGAVEIFRFIEEMEEEDVESSYHMFIRSAKKLRTVISYNEVSNLCNGYMNERKLGTPHSKVDAIYADKVDKLIRKNAVDWYG